MRLYTDPRGKSPNPSSGGARVAMASVPHHHSWSGAKPKPEVASWLRETASSQRKKRVDESPKCAPGTRNLGQHRIRPPVPWREEDDDDGSVTDFPAAKSGHSRSKPSSSPARRNQASVSRTEPSPSPARSQAGGNEDGQVADQEAILRLQLQRAKIELARAKASYLQSLAETERTRSRSVSVPKASRVEKQLEVIEEDNSKAESERAAFDTEWPGSASESEFGSHIDPDQCSQFSAASEQNPFAEIVKIDSDDEFLANAVRRGNGPVRPLYVDADQGKSGTMAKLRRRLQRVIFCARRTSDD
ncbi:Uncharacterized protein PBTT_02959 [Plasmodiophora brassicae]|uniref:Uncharacterized protein n=1 Tax=Plasmodiophora brassicae TaxID=37360 RepID=A0A0G4J7K9_PLABS|nr:hypothetical protein PBRA_003109 [Plasmodiophora brassicae]SPQ95588.1 unnamed protein product [Plasmodiophora brassicae]